MEPITLTITGQKLTASVPENRVVQNTRKEYYCEIAEFDEDTAAAWSSYVDQYGTGKGCEAVFYNDSIHDPVSVKFVLKDDGLTSPIFLPENILNEIGNLRIAIVGRTLFGEVLTTEWCDPIPIVAGPYVSPNLS